MSKQKILQMCPTKNTIIEKGEPTYDPMALYSRGKPFKSYTPRIQNSIKLDSVHMKLLKQKSFAKIYEPTTFIEENEESYEQQVDGVQAK
jgi:hypothetical protein